MDFYTILDQAIDLLRQRQRVTYRALKVQFQLDDEILEALKDELIEAQQLARDENGRILVWTGDAGIAPRPASVPGVIPAREPLIYTPPLSGGEDPHLPQCPRRRAQTRHRAVC